MKVYLGADHRGFKLKEVLKIWLWENKITGEDMGASEFDKVDDYVDFAQEVSYSVSTDIKKGLDSKGVVICGSGVGVDITANKIEGIRCGLGFSSEQIQSARKDDDINILALPSDFITQEQAKEMVKIFLETPFSNAGRHIRRIDKIKKLEK